MVKYAAALLNGRKHITSIYGVIFQKTVTFTFRYLGTGFDI